MSEYQYFEFCKINTPLTINVRKEMASLSSRAKVSTHGASYEYHYSNFRGDPKELLLKYFDVFFYISNWGCLQLMFKFILQEVDLDELKKYYIEHTIEYHKQNSYIILDINFNSDDGFGWINGDGMLPDLLPLYDEIRSANYQFLYLVAKASNANITNSIKNNADIALSHAQQSFFKFAGIEHNLFYE